MAYSLDGCFSFTLFEACRFSTAVNELACRDQIEVYAKICWFAATRNAHSEFSVRKHVLDFFESPRFLSINRRRNKQQTQEAP
jgi:hypothetical protein